MCSEMGEDRKICCKKGKRERTDIHSMKGERERKRRKIYTLRKGKREEKGSEIDKETEKREKYDTQKERYAVRREKREIGNCNK